MQPLPRTPVSGGLVAPAARSEVGRQPSAERLQSGLTPEHARPDPWACPSWGSLLPVASGGRGYRPSQFLTPWANSGKPFSSRAPCGIRQAVIQISCTLVQLFFQSIPAASSPRLGPDQNPQGRVGSKWGRWQSQATLRQAGNFSLLSQSTLLLPPPLTPVSLTFRILWWRLMLWDNGVEPTEHYSWDQKEFKASFC